MANTNSKEHALSMGQDKESPEYIFYDNIEELLIRSFWYHSNDTMRNSWVRLRSHCPTNDSSGISTLAYLTVMLHPVGILHN